MTCPREKKLESFEPGPFAKQMSSLPMDQRMESGFRRTRRGRTPHMRGSSTLWMNIRYRVYNIMHMESIVFTLRDGSKSSTDPFSASRHLCARRAGAGRLQDRGRACCSRRSGSIYRRDRLRRWSGGRPGAIGMRVRWEALLVGEASEGGEKSDPEEWHGRF